MFIIYSQTHLEQQERVRMSRKKDILSCDISESQNIKNEGIYFYLFLRQGHAMFLRLVLNSLSSQASLALNQSSLFASSSPMLRL